MKDLKTLTMKQLQKLFNDAMLKCNRDEAQRVLIEINSRKV